MNQYILRRVLLMIPTMVLISVLTFVMIRFISGDAVDVMYAENNYASTKEEMREQLGLNQPIVVQYGRWLGQLLKGDLGTSLFSGRTVLEELSYRLPVTVQLGLASFALAMVIAIPFGVISAVKQDTPIDYAVRIYAIGGLSIPNFWLATMILIYGAKWFQWAPPLTYVSFTEDPVKNIKQIIVPALVLGIFGWGSVIRMMRTMLLEVLREDYIRTARAKGLPSLRVIARHAMPNAVIPVITVIGIYIPTVLGGTVIIETIFGLPGIGRYTLDAISNRDYPVLQMIILVFAAIVLMTNLLVDISYGLLDPRMRYR